MYASPVDLPFPKTADLLTWLQPQGLCTKFSSTKLVGHIAVGHDDSHIEQGSMPVSSGSVVPSRMDSYPLTRFPFAKHDEDDAYLFCDTCSQVLREEWGAVGSCLCLLHASKSEVYDSHLHAEDGNHHYHSLESIADLILHQTDSTNEQREWDEEEEYCFCELEHEDLEREKEIVSLILLREVGFFLGDCIEGEDAFPFCPDCGQVLEEKGGPVGC